MHIIFAMAIEPIKIKQKVVQSQYNLWKKL